MKYQEITIIPSAEISMHVICEKLLNNLHIGLADVYNKHGVDTIGMSFPAYYLDPKGKKSSLGSKLRLIAPDEKTLSLLDIEKRLSPFRDYIHIRQVAEVPEGAGAVVVKRYRFRPIDQQAKRHAARHQITFDAALKHCLKFRRKEIFPPFVKLRSHSNREFFPLVILQEETEQVNHGKYNTYGLSKENSTVPHW